MTAPSPAAAGLPAEDVERIARALHDADAVTPCAWPCGAKADMYRTLAAAALAEMQPTAAEEAVKRVEAVLPRLDKEARISSFPLRFGYEDSARLVRAALAPVPHDADGGERR